MEVTNSRTICAYCGGGETLLKTTRYEVLDLKNSCRPLSSQIVMRPKFVESCDCIFICCVRIHCQTCSQKFSGSRSNIFQRWLGMTSGSFWAVGQSFLNFFSCKRDKLSVMLNLPGVCFALATTFSRRHFRVNALRRVMTCSDLEVIVFTAKTTAALSQWNRIFLLHSSLPQRYNGTRMGNNSSTVISPVNPDSCHSVGHVAYDHLPPK